MAEVTFRCDCGQIEGKVADAPKGGLHLVCHCDSCRAGALYCGADLGPNDPVDLYLTPPHNLTITMGQDAVAPFAFSPKGVLRWKAKCCGVQMFSSQPNPKTAFMSVRTDRLTTPEVIGPVRTKSFIPGVKGLGMHQGKGALLGLIAKAVMARLSGKWRKTPIYDVATGKPLAPVTLVPKEEKRALLGK